MTMMDPANYRLRLLIDVLNMVVLPCAVLHFLAGSFSLPTAMVAHWYTMIPSYILSIILAAVVRSVLAQLHNARARRNLGAREIPCIKGKWPGNIDVLLKMLRAFGRSYILDVYRELFEEYQCTTLNTRILWTDHIITMDQEHTKFVLATGFEHFWRGRRQKERMERFLGEGIFNRDDEASLKSICRVLMLQLTDSSVTVWQMWRMHRSNTRPFFARERISDFEVFELYTGRTLNILSGAQTQGEAIDVQDLYARFALDAASAFLFGAPLDTLSATLPVAGEAQMGPKGSATADPWGSFAHAFEAAQQVITARARVGYWWPVFEVFGDRNKPHVDAVHQWLDPLVRRALNEKASLGEAGLSSPVSDKTFLQHLAESTDDPIIIRDQLLSLLLAARDTTACLLTYVTYLMAIYPDVARKLRAEVLEHCGPSGELTYESLRNLKYMRAVINETLRLFPPVPLNVRESRAASGCALPPSDPTFRYEPADTSSAPISSDGDNDLRPLHMPGGAVITILPLLTQRSTSLWGEDAEEFDPARWLEGDERLARFLANPTMFTPFSAGPRICVGQNYAYNEASFFLVRLLQQFNAFELASDVQPQPSLPPSEWKEKKGRQAVEQVWPAAALTLYVKGGLWVRIGRHSEQ